MKVFTSRTQKIGERGEEICCEYLSKSGFYLIERNFTIPIGEIDIVAQKDDRIHFIEVKSIQCTNANVSYETLYNPAENFNAKKIQKFKKTMLAYIKKHGVSCETQIDLYVVYIDRQNKKHRIRRIENIT